MVNGSGLSKLYIATAQAYDAEMSDKIAAHKIARGEGWQTIEAPLDVCTAISAQPEGCATLLDCATMWLSNILLDDRDIDRESADLLAALSAAPGPVVVVSNEVGAGIVPENALARRFRNAQGRLNQQIAAQADTVVLVAAGLPLVLKGALPA